MSEQSPFARADSPRLDDIEIKLAFAEELLDSLNRTVAKQADRIDALSREVIALKGRLDNSERVDLAAGVDGVQGNDEGNGATANDGSIGKDDRPPHY